MDRRNRCDHRRRFAARGNDDYHRDPRDVEEIERLQHKLRDLERDLKIKRLRQRFRDLELKWEMRNVETKSDAFVWDEGDDEEENPFVHPQSRFIESVYEDESGRDCLSIEEPRYDEDGTIPDAEECLQIQKFLGWIIIQEDEPVEENVVQQNMFQKTPIKTRATTGIRHVGIDAFMQILKVIKDVLKLNNTVKTNCRVIILGGSQKAFPLQMKVKGVLLLLYSALFWIFILELNFEEKVTLITIDTGAPYEFPLEILKDLTLKQNLGLCGSHNYLIRMRISAHIGVRIKIQLGFGLFLQGDHVIKCMDALAKDGFYSKISGAFFDILKTRGRVFFEDGERDKDVGRPSNPIDRGPASPNSVRLKLTRTTCEGKLKELVVLVFVMKVWKKGRQDVPFDPGGFDS
ncbi:hypothetical protein SSX86_000709 [Deinandra increscens subsp. villosa]|uniref:Uncharacterized protein n=1 Tax=Deinandra increscens subsp. villosa TaxID=3103831 RepID=A0AAP0DTH9_9ASTR